MAEIQEKTSLQTKIVTPQELEQQAHYAQQVLAWNRAFETKTGHKRRVQVITFGCQQNIKQMQNGCRAWHNRWDMIRPQKAIRQI